MFSFSTLIVVHLAFFMRVFFHRKKNYKWKWAKIKLTCTHNGCYLRIHPKSTPVWDLLVFWHLHTHRKQVGHPGNLWKCCAQPQRKRLHWQRQPLLKLKHTIKKLVNFSYDFLLYISQWSRNFLKRVQTKKIFMKLKKKIENQFHEKI